MIDYRKNYIMVLDIETANFIEDALAYDVGYIVGDTKGNIYEKGSFMVAELFIDNKDLLKSAFYNEKIPQYWEDYKQGKRKLASIYTIRRTISSLIYQYKIKEVYAYNARFDTNGLNRTYRYLTKSKYRYFLPYGVKVCCIWNMACQVLYTQPTFQKQALKNMWYNINTHNVRTSAEIGKRYISQDYNFKEHHTGLEDVLIEYEILLKCLSQHKKLDKSINNFCWKIPQKNFKKLLTNTKKGAIIKEKSGKKATSI